MTRDELIRAISGTWQREMKCSVRNCPSCANLAGEIIDIVLEEAASIVKAKANEWHKEWRDGYKASTHLEGKSDGADECVEAILALTSKGNHQ